MMKCKICAGDSTKKMSVRLRNKYDVDYFHCQKCGFLQTEEPYWLEEAYASPINVSDTGYLDRNIFLSKQLTMLLSLFFERKAKFVDYAGGYGVFVRLMRDIGFDFYWDDKYTSNLFAKGFEYLPTLGRIEAVTSFESFEHFVEPMQEIAKILSIAPNIIFTTDLLPQPIPTPGSWMYYAPEHGQHISFYSESTFSHIAQYFGLKYVHLGSLHLLTTKEHISNAKLNLLRFGKFGLYRAFQYGLSSKIQSDYLLSLNHKDLKI